MLRSSLARGIAQQRVMLRRSMSTSTAARPLRRVAAFIGGGGVALGGGYYLMQPKPQLREEDAEEVDALIIGGGIMGTTVALMLKLLQPKWKVKLVEQHDRVAQEASNEWHNAGTGHAALCEPNYTPMNKEGEVLCACVCACARVGRVPVRAVRAVLAVRARLRACSLAWLPARPSLVQGAISA